MTYTIYASNIKTGESLCLGNFQAEEDCWDALENDLEWDEEDVKSEWQFQITNEEGVVAEWQTEDPFAYLIYFDGHLVARETNTIKTYEIWLRAKDLANATGKGASLVWSDTGEMIEWVEAL